MRSIALGCLVAVLGVSAAGPALAQTVDPHAFEPRAGRQTQDEVVLNNQAQIRAALENLQTDLQVTQAKVDALARQVDELLREIRALRAAGNVEPAHPAAAEPAVSQAPDEPRRTSPPPPSERAAPPAPDGGRRTSALRAPPLTTRGTPAEEADSEAPAQAVEAPEAPEGDLPTVVTSSRAPAAPPPLVPQEVEDQFAVYENALNEYHAQNYAAARTGFQDFLDRYPSSTYANNAQFYIGQCWYAEQNYPKAIDAYQKVVDNYPRGTKVPSAMLKLGYAHEQLGLKEEARRRLQAVIDTYPFSSEAQLAQNHLKQMK